MDNLWTENVELIKSGYCRDLCDKVAGMRSEETIFPPQNLLLNALDQISFDDVKVVILGQDPYHGAGQAHGLAFSVPEGIPVPPSLRNIFKEIDEDIYPDCGGDDLFTLSADDEPKREHSTDLTRWANQGVLLLNATLSVSESQAASHASLGWQELTDNIIESISENREDVVFILWGGHARKKAKLIDNKKHCILEGPHPSPLSAYRGFFGCKHFSKANDFLSSKGKTPITW